MLWQRRDLRDGVRTLRRQPAFTLAAIVTFALGIGTTTAIFAALDAVILTPLPFADPAALVVAWGQDLGPRAAGPRGLVRAVPRVAGASSGVCEPRRHVLGQQPGHLDARGR